MIDTLRLLVTLALRNVGAHRVKSLIVGSILFFGTFLVVFGRSFIDSLEASMATSITSSLSGHLQVYARDAKDPLALFGGMGMGSSDIGEIPEVGSVLDPIAAVPNVAAVVPMGITNATVFGSNELDGVLEELRRAVDRADTAAIDERGAQVRQIVRALLRERSGAVDAAVRTDEGLALVADLERVARDDWWSTSFRESPGESLELLDTRIAPQAAEGRPLYLRTIGTDIEQFTQTFDRFYIVDGEPIPPGRRGFLFSKRTYEKLVKHKVARELDDLWEEAERGNRIADSATLQEQVKRMARQVQRVTFQLSPADAESLTAALRAELADPAGDLEALVARFLTVDDTNLQQRREWFYANIAPKVRLYDFPVGSVMALRSFTRSGYLRSINVTIYGTYEFRGLEKSDLASATNLTDMITFRDLYGKMTSDQLAELDAIRASVGAVSVTAENAEDLLFGGPAPTPDAGAEPGAAPAADPAPAASELAAIEGSTLRGTSDGVAAMDAFVAAAQADGPPLDEKVYPREEIRRGLALNAAIVLKDPDRVLETRAAIEALVAERQLNLQVVDWQNAAGIIGQFIVVIRAVLFIAIGIIFLVALVIINNSMVMTTTDRIGEIGTMRAIGSQRGMVVGIFLLETIVLGLIAGAAGAAAGVGLIAVLGQVGVPATTDILVVLFAGPRLYPSWGFDDVAFGLVSVLFVGVASTLYPAWLASRVQPVVAMSGKE